MADRAAELEQAAERPGVRGGLFLIGLIVALLIGFAVGRAAGVDNPRAAPGSATANGANDGHAGHTHGSASGATGADVGGLAVSSSGYTLAVDATTFEAGAAGSLRFRVLGPDRAPVTGYVIAHDKPLHLVVVRRDLTGYQHLHPTLAADGTWSVPLTLPTPGVWRAYADFVVDAAGKQTAVTLGADLTVPGAYAPTPLPAAARESTVDGYVVTLTGTPQVGASVPLIFRVQRDGKAVTLERYLGAYGHLVVVREGDLGYVHVHPDDGQANAGVTCWLFTPSPGRYRAYFDFQVAGVVRTAELTLQVA